LNLQGVPFHEWQQWGPVPVIALITVAVSTMALVSMAAAVRFSAHGLPLLGSAVVAMTALMCGNFMTIRLDSDIENRMPVLNDVWLYIHTNMIIASYALIGIAYVTAGMYVVGRLLTRPNSALWLSMLIPTAIIPLIGAIPGIGLMIVMPAWIPFALVIVAYGICCGIKLLTGERLAVRSQAAWVGEGLPAIAPRHVASALLLGGATAVVAGTATMIAMAGGSGPQRETERPRQDDGMLRGLAQVLDGATMLLLELFFITLWTGIIMGAIWADHSWGRPWGWDPKEVFALNTWIIFLILVHVRIKVQDKALWTAVLAVVGCSVMLFNWIVVNFFITGLHSYA
jgi:ABC-type transport system involved in cytochrome c biogenesis permease subunit